MNQCCRMFNMSLNGAEKHYMKFWIIKIVAVLIYVTVSMLCFWKGVTSFNKGLIIISPLYAEYKRDEQLLQKNNMGQ